MYMKGDNNMPDGVDIRGRRPGRFPGPGFPGRRLPARRFPRFFFYPIYYGSPQRRCDYIDRFGRCCDRYGRCYFDGYRGGYPLIGSREGDEASWPRSGDWDDMDYDDIYDDNDRDD